MVKKEEESILAAGIVRVTALDKNLYMLSLCLKQSQCLKNGICHRASVAQWLGIDS